MGSSPSSMSAERLGEIKQRGNVFTPGSLFDEKERIARRSRVRQFMFGSLDGLLVPLGVVSGVAGGTANSKIVVIAGVAEAFAGALSMGAGEYITAKSESQVQQAAIRSEQEEIEVIPEVERHELELLFEREGLKAEDARLVAEKLTTSHTAWVNTMVEKELGLSAEPAQSHIADSLYMGFSYIVASIVPLAPYLLLPVKRAFFVSVALTIAVLFLIGAVKGRLASMSLLRSAAEVVLVGAGSAAGGYLLGVLLPHVL
jgi:vacuolar iron transporter family protein